MRAGWLQADGWVLRPVIAVVGCVLAAVLAACSPATVGTSPSAEIAGSVQSLYAYAEGIRPEDQVRHQARDIAVLSWSAELNPDEPFSARALETAYANSTAPAAPGASTAGSSHGARVMSLWDLYREDVERREQQLRDHIQQELPLAEVRAHFERHQGDFTRQDEITVRAAEWENGRALAASEVLIDASNVRMLQEGDDAVISAALTLTPGQQTTVQRPDGRFVVLECLARKDGGVENFDAVAQAAASQLATERFEAEVLRRVAALP